MDKHALAMDNARGIPARRGIVRPELDFRIFSRCMNFAVKMDWGAELH